MTPRRSPTRHKVRTHTRKGNPVRSHQRGSGIPIKRKHVTVKSRIKVLKPGDAVILPSAPSVWGDDREHENLKGGPYISDLHIDVVEDGKIDVWPVYNVSYVSRDDKMIFCPGGMRHDTCEDIGGYDPADYANTKRITRIGLNEDGSIKMYTYGVGPRAVEGADGYPSVTASSLRKMISRGLIKNTDRIMVFFDKFGRSGNWYKHSAQEALGILKDARRMNR